MSEALASMNCKGLEEDEFDFPQTDDLREVHDSESEDLHKHREFGIFSPLKKKPKKQDYLPLFSDDSEEDEGLPEHH